ncbi:hypothetical protein BDY24DRAFT_367921 [Mrakia frigida]|uniref:uncharacterized protein n=1 Tax=Mrakia frigida TaxID=29902 RepID=UPI003FCC21AD
MYSISHALGLSRTGEYQRRRAMLTIQSFEDRRTLENEVGQETFSVTVNDSRRVVEHNQADNYVFRPLELESESLDFYTARFTVIPHRKSVKFTPTTSGAR